MFKCRVKKSTVVLGLVLILVLFYLLFNISLTFPEERLRTWNDRNVNLSLPRGSRLCLLRPSLRFPKQCMTEQGIYRTACYVGKPEPRAENGIAYVSRPVEHLGFGENELSANFGPRKKGRGVDEIKFRRKHIEDYPPSDEETVSCVPLHSVVMVKTHKSCSSTLQNILFRKAEDLNLSVALPPEEAYIGSPENFNRKFVLGDDGKRRYNIMASHMKFVTWKDIQEVMAVDAKYISVLRNPVKQYESMYTYYAWKSTRYMVDLRTFLQAPEKYMKLYEPEKPNVAGRNSMTFDNGLDARKLEDGDPRVDKLIAELDQRYHLVLIAEYFDESLILLKDLMCWTIYDVIHFNMNSRSEESLVETSSRDEDAILKWNWADVKLYSHFNKTLWEKIANYGEMKMASEVAHLREMKKNLMKECIGTTINNGDQRVWYPQGIRIDSYIVNSHARRKHLCGQLTRPEHGYLNLLRERVLSVKKESSP